MNIKRTPETIARMTAAQQRRRIREFAEVYWRVKQAQPHRINQRMERVKDRQPGHVIDLMTGRLVER